MLRTCQRLIVVVQEARHQYHRLKSRKGYKSASAVDALMMIQQDRNLTEGTTVTAAKKAAKREAKRIAIVTQGDKQQREQARTIWTKRIPRNPGQSFNPTGKQFANK